jgi:hypothetical protein
VASLALSGCQGSSSSADGGADPFVCSGGAADCLHALAGDYAGTYTGDTRGTWQVTISALGQLAGTAHNTVIDADYDLTGTADAAGRMIFGTSSDGNAFSGQVAQDFSVSGTWSMPPHSGTFVGRRTSGTVSSGQDAKPDVPCPSVAEQLGSCAQFQTSLVEIPDVAADPCYWRIDPAPADPTLVNIAIECVLLTQGTQDADGSWSLEDGAVTLTGEICNILTYEGVERVDYIYGCPTVQ